MIYTDMTKKAMKLCFEAHKDQVDKSGLPYVFHPFHVAEQMQDEVTTTVALLHDVVEDTDYTIQDLIDMGFPISVTDALSLLTHDKSIPYMDYVAAIKENTVARIVKLADLAHNSDLSRLGSLNDESCDRYMKYRKAISLLGDDQLVETFRFQECKPFREFININRSEIVDHRIEHFYINYWPKTNGKVMSDEPVVLELDDRCILLRYLLLSDLTIHVGPKEKIRLRDRVNDVICLRDECPDFFDYYDQVKREDIEGRTIIDIDVEQFSNAFECNIQGDERPEGGDYFSTIKLFLDSGIVLCFCGADAEADGYIYVWCYRRIVPYKRDTSVISGIGAKQLSPMSSKEWIRFVSEHDLSKEELSWLYVNMIWNRNLTDQENMAEFTKEMLELGFDPNVMYKDSTKDECFESPLIAITHCDSESAGMESLKLMFEAGADPNKIENTDPVETIYGVYDEDEWVHRPDLPGVCFYSLILGAAYGGKLWNGDDPITMLIDEPVTVFKNYDRYWYEYERISAIDEEGRNHIDEVLYVIEKATGKRVARYR